jgi:two-component system phosphate regulon sensor histidine kinase PhoR
MEHLAWLVIGVVLGAAVGSWLAARHVRRAGLRACRRHLRLWRSRYGAARDEAALQALLRDRTFGTVPLALIRLDGEMRIREANPTACEWFGLDPAALPTLMAATGSADLREAVEAACGHYASGVGARAVVRQRAYSASVSALPDGGALMALRDDTELEHLARARRDLVANISHDLRTPLTSITLVAEGLASQAGADPDQRHDMLVRLLDHVGGLRELAESLIDLNRLESGRAILQLQPERLGPLVQHAAGGLRPQLEKKHIHLVSDVPDALFVLADAPQLRRVIGNLLDNACRFSADGGEIRVTARRAPDVDMVEVSVSDDGPGIAPGDVERVFERFYRGDPSRAGAGKGLGLAIARHVVEGHGGRMWVEAVAHGATIRFRVPAANQ